MIQNAPRQFMCTVLSYTKIFLLIFTGLLFSATAIANSERPYSTTNILDPHFEQALIDLGIDSNGLNGNILNSDALVIETLFIGNRSISYLDGIEAFENLKNLYASSNNIITADFSQNIDLEVLDLENNKISSLNVTNNSVLREIRISNNQLNVLDVSNNLQLEHLSCNLNALTVLDVSINSLLEVLGCYANNLTSIDLSSNLALKMLFISENNLNALDLSMNTGLDTITIDNNNISSINLSNNINLEYLGCSNNNLNALDISANTNLTRILCNNNSLNELDISAAPDLFLFYTMNNQIESLDLTNNTALRFFRAENNLLESLDIRNGANDDINEFVTTQNPSLTCVFVDDASASFLVDWELDAASNFVEDNSECETLSINDEVITDFSLFPNPANGEVNIGLNTPNASLKLYTIKGQLLFEKQLMRGNNSINISDFSSGIYVVAIQSEGNITTEKLVIN